METVEIPRRSVFRAQEVCDLAQVQPYVLSSWEAEFPDLGTARSPDGPRTYRRADVELVLRIKQLVFGDGLTISGARRRLNEEGLVSVAAPSAPDGEEAEPDLDDDQILDAATRRNIRNVRSGLEWILGVLGGGLDAGVPDAGRTRKAQPLKKRSGSAKVGKAGKKHADRRTVAAKASRSSASTRRRPIRGRAKKKKR